MDIETLLKLEKNPHYKLNAKQQAVLDAYKASIEFGIIPLHDNRLKKQGRRSTNNNYE